MDQLLDDEGLRHLMITAMTAPTARDKQVTVGASNLANECDRCLARDMLGIRYETSRSRRLWMGAWLGTAAHARIEAQIDAMRLQGVETERHVTFGHIKGYGDVGGTIDLDLGSQIVDTKSSTREKIALLRDFISIQSTGEPIFGRKHKWIAGAGRTMMPQAEYDKNMAAMVAKVQRGYGQVQLYMLGHGNAKVGTLFHIARDGNGWYEVPDFAGYDDWTKQHDTFPLTFAFNEQYALDLLARGQSIWDRIAQDAGIADFEMAENCFICADEIRVQALEAQAAIEAATEPGEPVLVALEAAA